MEITRNTQHVAEYIDCSYRQLNRWCSLHLFGDEEEWSPGSGGRVTFEDRHIVWAWTCARLTELGVQVETLRSVVKFLSSHVVPNSGDVLLVFEDGTPLLWRRTDVIPSEPCWCVPLLTFEEIMTEWSDRQVMLQGLGG